MTLAFCSSSKKIAREDDKIESTLKIVLRSMNCEISQQYYTLYFHSSYLALVSAIFTCGHVFRATITTNAIDQERRREMITRKLVRKLIFRPSFENNTPFW